jgi:2-polyprenyl-3-methyl-5-hydroxy-6-metoxy-1,4-benzoquinol methylase
VLEWPPAGREWSTRLAAETRFGFGKNWLAYSSSIDDSRLSAAKRSLSAMLSRSTLVGTSFLDAGSGSGLFSLAARELGAERIHSFDYDEDSVECTRRLCNAAPNWTVERGDLLDARYMAGLGKFDIVYSWGVLHHTGDMWTAMAHVCDAVAPGGKLFIAIYNDQGSASRLWRTVTRLYNRLPQPLRPAYVAAVMLPSELKMFLTHARRGRFVDYFRRWTRSRDRGMDYWRDLVDWVGGYPFEVAKPEEIFEFCRRRGFTLEQLTTSGGHGCNQFVFSLSND